MGQSSMKNMGIIVRHERAKAIYSLDFHAFKENGVDVIIGRIKKTIVKMDKNKRSSVL